MKKVYFPNINGLRFIAAFLVIVHHTENMKSLLGMSNYAGVPFIHIIGKLGVILFFVLSGFLITYLLLIEKRDTHAVSIKNFYIRRILRIWPLYYLIIILGLFVYPNFSFFDLPIQGAQSGTLKYILFFLIFPNLALAMSIKVPFISLTWSIGVEEQFYIIWPNVLKRFKPKLQLFFVVLVVYLAIKMMLYFFMSYNNGNLLIEIVYNFWNSFVISAMAIGAIFAYLGFKDRDAITDFLFKKHVQLGAYIIVLMLFATGYEFPLLHYECYSILFGVIILNLACNPSSILKLEFKILNYLGKISYGLYMFHPIAIFLILKLLVKNNLVVNYVAILIFIIALTSFLAALSYHIYEERFIKAKKKFSQVLSGENVNK